MEEHNVGRLIAILRKSKGWTQVELAEKLQVSDKTISKWESGAGLPEISQFPTMSKLFDVSIDYLMTGKEPEKEILTISKSELCAKNDDVSLAEEVKDLSNDENGKNIVDYILQYQSLNAFKKLCEIDDRFVTRFSLLDAITLAVLSNSLYVLKGKEFKLGCYMFSFDNENEIKSLLPECDEGVFNRNEDKALCVLPENFFTMLATDKRITDETLNVFLTNQNNRNCVWYHAFPYLIEEAYRNGNEDLLRRLIDLSKESNGIAYKTIKPEYDAYNRSYNYVMNYFYLAPICGGQGHGLVRILESTIKQALEDGDFGLVDEFNKINSDISANFNRITDNDSKCYVASEDEIRVAKLKQDKSLSEDDIAIQSAIHGSIIDISELGKISDFEKFKEALYDYPIHYFEVLYGFYIDKNIKELFRVAVDNSDDDLAGAIADGDATTVKACIKKYWSEQNNHGSMYAKPNPNEGFLYTESDEARDNGPWRCQQTLGEISTYLQSVRKRLINAIMDRIDRDKTVDGLTKEYFESELQKGNIDNVVIKLCIRLEAVLKCDFGCTGTFYEMIDQYCEEHLEGEEWDEDLEQTIDASDKETINLLHKLRKARNSLVHAEKSNIKLTNKELKNCIEYICSL